MRKLVALAAMLFASPAMASDWYISPSSPFTSRTIEGTQCRYLRMDSTDSGYSPALDTHAISKAKIQHDWNGKDTGTGASVMLKSCSSPTDTGTCSNFQADLDGNNTLEDASLTTDVEFYATVPPQYLRALTTTPAVSPAITTVVVCGWTGSVPLSEIDPFFKAMDTETELETQLGGLNVWTEADGPLGGGGGGSTPTDIAQGTRTSTTVPITSSTGADATLTAATTSLAGVMTASDKTKLDGIQAGATNDDVPESGDFGNAAGLNSDGSIKTGAVEIQDIAAIGDPAGKFLRGDGTWATPPGGGTGISALFDDADPTLSADLDLNNFDMVNVDRVGGSLYFADSQADVELALTEGRCGQGYGNAGSTGCEIRLACGPIAWDDLKIGLPDDGQASHSGVHLRGCGGGGLMASDFSNAGGSTVLQASQATPMISLYSCSTCKVSDLVMDGNNVATVGIDWGDTGGGFPSTQGVVEDVNISYVNGPAIRTGYNETAITTLTRSGTTATAVSNGHGLSANEDLIIAGASDSNFNGTKRITIVDPNTFTYTVANTGAASATGAKFTSHFSSKTQVDTLNVRNSIFQYNDTCYVQMHSQSIGMVFEKVTCAHSNDAIAGVDLQAGEIAYRDGYFGTSANDKIFINRRALASRITVENNQTEWHGTTGGYFIKDDDTSAYDGATLWAPALVNGNAVVYAGAMNCFSVKREGSYEVTGNMFFNQGTPGQACTSSFSSDVDSYTQDRLMLTQYGNIETENTNATYPETWKPTLASSVLMQTPTIANDTAPNDCLNGQIWVDTNGTQGQRIHTCENGSWVAQAGGSGEAAVFQVSAYGTGYTGLSGAISACTAAGGGVIQLPEGTTTIDATAIASPIITLPAGTYGGRALCQLVGYGDVTPNQWVGGAPEEAQVGGSTLIVTNSGNKTVLKLTGHDQVLRDFALVTPNMTSGGIAVVTENRAHEAYATGEQGIGGLEWHHVSLNGPYPDTTRAGSGLVLQGIQNGHFLGGQVKGFTNGIVFTDHASFAQSNNANSFRSMRVADNTTGLLFNSPTIGQQNSLYGMTVEGNATGASFASGADMAISDYGSWWENNPTNISIASGVVVYNGYSSRFGSANSRQDIVRSVANSRGIPDMVSGGYITSGVNYTNQAVINITNNQLTRTDTIASPFNISNDDVTAWFNIDGIKYPTWNDDANNPHQVTIEKTKVYGDERYFVNLSESEFYGEHMTVISGSDADVVGMNIDVFNTGGSHADGDEGLQGPRIYISDKWLTVSGTLSETIPSGAGTSEIAVSVTQEQSKMVGEGKIIVFGSGTNYTLSTPAPGVMDASGNVTGSWSGVGGAGKGVWQLSTSPGIASTGYCLSSAASTYNDINGNATRIWLPIVGVSGSTITTEWLNQGYDAGVPYQYPATTAAGGISIAPCAKLGRPNLNGDYVADKLTIIRAAGFPGASGSFTVGSYPGISQMGVQVLMANTLGRMYESAGVKVTNLAENSISDMAGRYQQGTAFLPWTIGIEDLIDGKHHGWRRGLGCDINNCETGVDYWYTPDPGDLYFPQWLAQITFSDEDWTEDDYPRQVIRVGNDWTRDLTLDTTDGWGMHFDPFLRKSQTIAQLTTPNGAGKPNQTGGLVDWSQLVNVPGGFADNQDDTGGGGFDSTALDAVTWSDGANASNIWTFDVSGTDHTMTAGNGVMTFGDSVTVTDVLSAPTLTLTGTGTINGLDSIDSTTETTLEGALDLQDINDSGCSASQTVRRNAGDTAWECYTPSFSTDLASLTDVTLTTPATGSVLVKSAGNWIDGAVDLADTDAVTGTLPGANVQTFGSTNAGVVPQSGGGTTNYLRADGSWAAPGGGSGEANTLGSPDLGSEVNLINSVPKTGTVLNLVSLEADDFTVTSNIITIDTGATAGIQAYDADLNTIAGLTATSGNVMFAAGSAWTSDATPAINCSDCTGTAGGLTAGVASTVATAVGGDSTSSVAILADTTGNQAVKTDGGLTYDTTTDTLTAGSFATAATATPTILLQDSTTSGEASIELTDSTGPESTLALRVDTGAGALTTQLTLDGVNDKVTFAVTPDIGANGLTYSTGVLSSTDLEVLDDGTISNSEVADDITASNYLPLAGGTVTGTINLDSATEGNLRLPVSTSLPGTCTLGDTYVDSDADTDGTVYFCRATNTWKDIDDDGGAGGFTSFAVTGDDGAPAVTITDGNTLAVTGAGGITVEDGDAGADTLSITYSPSNAETGNEGVIDLADLQGVLTVAKGGTGASPTVDDSVLVSSAADTAAWKVIADSDGAGQKLVYDQATNAFSAGTDDDVPDAADYSNLSTAGGLTQSPAGTITTSMNTARVLGRTTVGVGVMEELSVGAGLTLGTGTLNRAQFTGGDVTAAENSNDLQIAADVVNGTELADTITLDAALVFTQAGNQVTFNTTTAGVDINSTGNIADDLLHIHQTGSITGTGKNGLHVEVEDKDLSPVVHIATNGPAESAGAGDVIGLQIDTDDTADNSFQPIRVQDTSGGTPNTLFAVNYQGLITTASVNAASIATNGVDTDEINANAVGNSEMGDNAIQTAELADDAVGINEIDLIDSPTALADGNCLAYSTAAGGSIDVKTCGGGSSPWQTTSNVANLVTGTDSVTVGSATALAKLAVDGDTDSEIGFLVQGSGTQSADLMVAENSAGVDQWKVSAAGATTQVGTATIGTVSDPADAGAIRLDNATSIAWEASPAGTDVTMTVDSSEIVQIAGGTLDGADLSATSVPASVMAAASVVGGSAGTVSDGTIDGEDMNSNYAGRSLTETAGTPDVLDIDAEIYTVNLVSFTVKAPAATDDFLLVKIINTSTPTSFDCVAQGGSGLTTIDYSIEECNTAGASCAGIGATATATAVDTNINDASFTDTTLTAGNWIKAVAGTVTWTTPGFITCTLKGTVND